MSFSAWVALAAVIATIYGLIKRYETRLVLLLAGLVMCCCSLDPMAAFEQFDKSMTNRALIISICSSMGFAACVTLTKCDFIWSAFLPSRLTNSVFCFFRAACS